MDYILVLQTTMVVVGSRAADVWGGLVSWGGLSVVNRLLAVLAFSVGSMEDMSLLIHGLLAVLFCTFTLGLERGVALWWGTLSLMFVVPHYPAVRVGYGGAGLVLSSTVLRFVLPYLTCY